MTFSYPNIRQSVIVLLLIMLMLLGISVLAIIVSAVFRLNFLDSPYMLGVGNSVAIGVVLWRAKRRTQCSYQHVLAIKSFPPIFLLPILVAALGLSVVLSEADNALRVVLPMPEFIEKIMVSLTLQPKNLGGSLFALVIVAPFTEEFLFRGLFLQSFANQYTKGKAILVSSFLFGIFHLNPWQFTTAFVVGIVFSYWMLRFNSTLPGIIGHAILNSLTVVVSQLPFTIPGYNTDPSVSVFQPIWFDLIGVALLLISYLLFRILNSRRTHMPDIETSHI